jgi:hypothetical protein
MKATIILSPVDVTEIIRNHIVLNVEGVLNISSVKPVMEYDKFDERHTFNGIAVEINLKPRE